MQQHNDHNRDAADELAQNLINESRAIAGYQERIKRLEASVAKFEEQFGIPSNHVHDAIENNDLIETEEVCDWIMANELLQRARATQQ